MILDFPYAAKNQNETCYPTTCHQVMTKEDCAYAVSYASAMGFDDISKNATLIPGNFANLPVGCSVVSGIRPDDVMFFFNNNNEMTDDELANNADLETFLGEAANYDLSTAKKFINYHFSNNVKIICKKGTNFPIYFD